MTITEASTDPLTPPAPTPASGKTTFLRDAILIKGEVEGFAVNVVDTSNEILGEGDEPHPQFTLVRQDKLNGQHPITEHVFTQPIRLQP